MAAELCVAPELPHNPPALSAFHPAAAAAFQQAAGFVRATLSGP